MIPTASKFPCSKFPWRFELLALAMCLAAGLLSTQPASARQLAAARTPAPVALGSYADPYWGRQGDSICRRWCLEDRTPCDPVHFKAADSRCFGSVRTFYGVINCRINGETNPDCPTAPRTR